MQAHGDKAAAGHRQPEDKTKRNRITMNVDAALEHDRAKFALLRQRVSTLEDEKDDLRNQIESLRAEVVSYQDFSQELEEELKDTAAEIVRLQASAAADIAEIQAKATKSALIARLDAARARSMFIDTIHNLKASTLTTEQFEECKGTASQGRAEPAALKSRSAAQDILARASPGLSKELSAALIPGHAPQASCDHMSHYERICNAIERRSAIARVILSSHTPPSRQIVFTSDAKPHVNLSTEGSLSHCHPTEFLQMFSADAVTAKVHTAAELPKPLTEMAIQEAYTQLTPIVEESIKTVIQRWHSNKISAHELLATVHSFAGSSATLHKIFASAAAVSPASVSD